MLRAWRESRPDKPAQAVLADRLGVARQTYNKWEQGQIPPEMFRWFQIHVFTEGQVPWTIWATTPDFVALVQSIILSEWMDARIPELEEAARASSLRLKLARPT